MMDSIYIIPILIYFVIPIVGLATYIILVKGLKAKIDSVPYFSIFFLFMIYGGLLLIILTSVFWSWSKLLLSAALFQGLYAPIVAGLIVFFIKYDYSVCHKWIYYAAIAYFPLLLPVSIFCLIVS
ncbi:hypothetical protein M2451_000943 [Dysgonomonas sp. PFB1-18]|uniref:hypothetical protein n=1 Tax=unclassified Dysgonomonas TaxID=2630389 RepID=UPI00247583E8|nr:MULTISPECIES: hypothetical protein [unclassified Dysgonomonas]MDH6308632.1 hypothetical protein [Dysgonomonas sp. PF1-14]MDH6338133.1 hypothetical protein [Dysgonomonas sp. PF1-16]MDH6379630.1 hypothetical protein [Dysgonomonas sp. PFB1-18]MDH6396960.1 hypothetical protein [Dysgonomonas sp. PF1-23]